MVSRDECITLFPPIYMADGPNFEALFTGMKCLHGTNAEDVKTIVRYLRFYNGQEGYEMYLNHYLPLLPEEAAKEFTPKAEEKTEVVKITVKEPSEKVTDTTTTSISTPKKRSSK